MPNRGGPAVPRDLSAPAGPISSVAVHWEHEQVGRSGASSTAEVRRCEARRARPGGGGPAALGDRAHRRGEGCSGRVGSRRGGCVRRGSSGRLQLAGDRRWHWNAPQRRSDALCGPLGAFPDQESTDPLGALLGPSGGLSEPQGGRGGERKRPRCCRGCAPIWVGACGRGFSSSARPRTQRRGVNLDCGPELSSLPPCRESDGASCCSCRVSSTRWTTVVDGHGTGSPSDGRHHR